MITGNNIEELTSSFQQELTAFQTTQMEKITAAQQAGDFDLAQKLTEEIQVVCQDMSDELQQKIAALSNPEAVEESSDQSVYSGWSGIDLDAVVYDGDRDLYTEFNKDANIQQARAEMEKHHSDYSSRKDLLKSSLKLTRKLAPKIYEIGDHCKQLLDMDADFEFYVYQDDTFNAACYPPDENKLYIIFSSGIIEKFTNEELIFVTGHEIGHVLFDHLRYPASAIMHFGEEYLSPVDAMKLFSWKRAAEVSADRVGLLCCKDFSVAAKAFFKLSSGVTSNSLAFDLQEYVAQFVDLKAEMATENLDPSDWYSTHPFSPLRIKALELFSRSDTYRDLGGDSDSSMTEEEMEQEIARFMSLMDPAYLSKDDEVGGYIQRFMFMAGYLIAMADESVDEVEINVLGSLVDNDVFAGCKKEIEDSTEQDIIDKLCEVGEEINTHLRPMQKLNIIRDLAIISTADGEVHEEEMSSLYKTCNLLNIDPEFADQVIHDYTQER
ncbi:MAG: peptidase M48 [Gammaproteobacteria bacterium]|nr:MAG: peptidase M48 [Gammaproteobacteria bacterium]